MEKKRAKRLEIIEKHYNNGVKFVDEFQAYIDETVVIGAGTLIGPCVTLEGDTVIISRNKPYDNGDIVAVAVGANDVTLKRIIKKDTSILLVSENSAYEPMMFTKSEIESLPVTIIGKVVELRRKF